MVHSFLFFKQLILILNEINVCVWVCVYVCVCVYRCVHMCVCVSVNSGKVKTPRLGGQNYVNIHRITKRQKLSYIINNCIEKHR